MDEPLLDAATYLDALGVERRVQPNVIVVFDEAGLRPRPVWRRLIDKLDRSEGVHPFRFVDHLRPGVDLVVTSPGSPVMAVTVELLAAMGARRIVTVGIGAAIAPLDDGQRCVVVEARRDGAPLDYPSQRTTASDELSTALVSWLGATEVSAVSTDVPFRQTAARIAAHGTDVLDMECATLVQVADVVGVEAAAVVVISDHHSPYGWRAAEPEVTRRSLASCITTVAAGLETLT